MTASTNADTYVYYFAIAQVLGFFFLVVHVCTIAASCSWFIWPSFLFRGL